MNTTRCAVVALFLSSSVVADDASEVVALNFELNAGDTSRVVFMAERTRVKNGERTVQSAMNGEGKTLVEAHPDGFILIQNVDKVEMEADMGELSKFLKPIMESASSIETRTVVSNEGAILGVDGLEPLLDTMMENINLIIDESPDEVKPILTNLVPQLVNENSILAKISETWSAQVGMWIGSEFEKGYYYDVEYTEPVAAFGGVELGFTGTYSYVGKTNCNEFDTDLSCAELTYNSALSPESAETFTNAIFSQMNLPVPEGIRLALNTSLLLITEPSTLKPHYYEKVGRVSAPSGNGDGAVERIDRSTYTYSYE